jgi:hypothetical protein
MAPAARRKFAAISTIASAYRQRRRCTPTAFRTVTSAECCLGSRIWRGARAEPARAVSPPTVPAAPSRAYHLKRPRSLARLLLTQSGHSTESRRGINFGAADFESIVRGNLDLVERAVARYAVRRIPTYLAALQERLHTLSRCTVLAALRAARLRSL